MTAPPAPASFLSTRRGKLTLALLCGVQFLDVLDASIVNVALPSIQHSLHFSQQNLQWVLSGYVLTFGGFLLLGGRAADLLGRRRVLIAGMILFASSSLAGGVATNEATLITARLVQGIGAALMAPAALSIVTTSFKEGVDRHRALGVWGAMGGLGAAAGVFFGGVLSEGPGWRWVFYVNIPFCVLFLFGIFRLLDAERPAGARRRFDVPGAVLVTGGMLLLVYALIKAPD
ncbi:MAG: drug resistance transporter, EmrB/QacA subfamily, partial [Pseudonocardiales bacterium]|nr:drug resistance transporter, EmrB/QacA subfamily [Pseudonocardiales bacterium]